MTMVSRMRVSTLCVATSWFFMLTGSMILCACPGWPAMGVGFAGLALWLRKGVNRLAPMLALVACVFMTSAHLWEQFAWPGSRAARYRALKEEIRRNHETKQTAEGTRSSKTNTAQDLK